MHKLHTHTHTCTLSSTMPKPNINCPVECPKPHSAPKAEAAIRFRPMVKGVKACNKRGGGRDVRCVHIRVCMCVYVEVCMYMCV